jgi:hypothetical protein
MTRGFNLEIKDEQKAMFMVLASLKSTDLIALAAALEDLRPSLKRSEVMDQLLKDDRVSSIAQLHDITQALINLARTVQVAEADAASAVDAVFEAIADDDVVFLDQADLVEIKSLLARVITIPSLLLIGAGYSALNSRQRVLVSASIESDFRPLFIEIEGEPEIRGAVISHELRLKSKSGGKDEIIYVALDSEDLVLLSETLQDAQKEDAVLRAFAHRSNLPVLNASGEVV